MLLDTRPLKTLTALIIVLTFGVRTPAFDDSTPALARGTNNDVGGSWHNVRAASATQAGKGGGKRPSTTPPHTGVIEKAVPQTGNKSTAGGRAPVGSTPTEPPVTLTHEAKPDGDNGEVRVKVSANENPLIRLPMAQHGVTLVEFPGSDRLFRIHPGDDKLVTVEDSPTRKTDHYLVLRAGSGFVIAPPSVPTAQPKSGTRSATRSKSKTASAPALSPAVSVIVQMRSGLVTTMLIYPVAQLSKQVHRCVISYNRDEVIEARKNAGLAVNLGEANPTATPPLDTIAQKDTSAAASATSHHAVIPVSNTSPVSATRDIQFPVQSSPEEVVASSPSTSKKFDGRPVPSGVAAQNALAIALKDPKKFKHWSKPLHGLAVSTNQPHDLTERTRLVVIAVRNVKSEAIRLVDGYPDIFVETLNERGKSILPESKITKLYTITTSSGNVIPAGATVYYAIIYFGPILGAQQHLRVAVAQTNAADEPVGADLSKTAR